MSATTVTPKRVLYETFWWTTLSLLAKVLSHASLGVAAAPPGAARAARTATTLAPKALSRGRLLLRFFIFCLLLDSGRFTRRIFTIVAGGGVWKVWFCRNRA